MCVRECFFSYFFRSFLSSFCCFKCFGWGKDAVLGEKETARRRRKRKKVVVLREEEEEGAAGWEGSTEPARLSAPAAS